MAKTKYCFDGVLASYVAHRLKSEGSVPLSGIELELLEAIGKSAKLVSNKKLSEIEKIPLESVEYVTSSLAKKKMIERGSGWKLTKKGKTALEKALDLYEQSKQIALCDRTTSILIRASGTRIC